MSPAVPIIAPSIGRTAPFATAEPPHAGTAGRVTTITNSPVPGVRPRGINGAWMDFEGKRYVSAGEAVALGSDFTRIGEHHGWPVYRRPGDPSTIYVPMTADLVAPFSPRSR
jgi:hypothetical protein